MAKTNYPVGDFLIRVKNAALARQKQVVVAKTNIIAAVAKLLKEEGYLSEVVEEGGKLNIKLAYRKKEPVLLDIVLMSKPGLRVYMGADEMEERKGPAQIVVSTSKGLMTEGQAVKKRLGGEVIAKIY
jgi:small subunit ribosomal protein S8